MKLREKLAQKRFLMPVFGLLFAFFLCFVNSNQAAAKPLDAPLHTTPLTTLADLEDGTPEEAETPAETTEETAEEEPETCYDQVKGIGWLVCPTSGVLATAVDSIYKVISDLLVVQPMTTDSDSPIFIVWQYIRDLTNIVFIILIIVVIYSHLTGVGFDNYNIKKILPKLIITAILINLSYLICSALVDTSNIMGASLRGFFENIESQIGATGDAMVTWEAFAAILGGGGAVAGLTISAAGGLGAVLPMFILSLITAFLSILVGLATIAMRQAVVALLVMIAPLAFVCYMLPNTNKWFAKWKDTLSAMLIFFPMFSALFGASHLAGWALIAKAQQDGSAFMMILGMAVQIVPLFLSVPLMKMSGSVLGKVSSTLDNLSKGATGRLRPVAEDFRDTARARKLDEASRSRNLASGAYWRARFDRNKYLREEERAEHEENRKNTYTAYSNARSTGRTIKRWENGKAVYKTRFNKDGDLVDDVKINSSMRDNYLNRELKLANEADKLKTDNAMSNINAYLRSTEAKEDKALKALADSQAQNYLDLRTQQSAKARNDRSDQRFYTEAVRNASRRDDLGNLISNRNYHRLVRAGAGADAFDTDETIRDNALTTVTADAYDAYEKERAETSKRYSTLFDKQVTKDVLAQYKSALRANNIDAVTAAQNTLAVRGDYDKISENLRNFMDQTGEFKDLGEGKRLRLGSDFANTLALNLLGMKGADPLLGRLGKAINMETWRYTSKDSGDPNARSTDVMTFRDYIFGDQNGGNNQARTSAFELLKGTSIKDADRTFFGDMRDTFKAYGFSEGQFNEMIGGMMPQFISAIPTYESSGEQILNSMSLLTGLKNENGKWLRPVDKNGNFTENLHMNMIEKYLRGMTDKDLNVFKTDAYQAIFEAIAQSMPTPMTCYGEAKNGKFGFYPPQDVYKEFRRMINPNMIANLKNNLAQGTNSGMKDSIQIALGLAEPEDGEIRKE